MKLKKIKAFDGKNVWILYLGFGYNLITWRGFSRLCLNPRFRESYPRSFVVYDTILGFVVAKSW